MLDPYLKFLGKQVEVNVVDGQIRRGVLRELSYTYIMLVHPEATITRRYIIDIREAA